MLRQLVKSFQRPILVDEQSGPGYVDVFIVSTGQVIARSRSPRGLARQWARDNGVKIEFKSTWEAGPLKSSPLIWRCPSCGTFEQPNRSKRCCSKCGAPMPEGW